MPRKSKSHNTEIVYPLSAVRATALFAQGLAGECPSPTPEGIYSTIERIGCVQIDTLNLVQRSQYLTLWSRVGNYDTRDLDRVAYGARDGATTTPGTPQNDRKLFEYWLKEACLIPLSLYRYRLPKMRQYREAEHSPWWQRWISTPGMRETLDHVIERIRQEGAARSSDFVNKEKRAGSWWNWKPAKIALEYYYNRGDLMISHRVNFQRVYDLAERVLPSWVDTSEPDADEAARHLYGMAARALGVFEPAHPASYVRLTRPHARAIAASLIADGTLIPIKAVLHDGETHDLVVHRDHLETLKRAADGALVADRTTFLSPFDNLFWAHRRDMLFWGFFQTLEAYKPQPKRIWGYFCLPILHRDRLIGRFDPKIERKTGLMRLKALHLEPGVTIDDGLVADVASTMREFMAFHSARDLVIEHSNPPEFGAALMQAR